LAKALGQPVIVENKAGAGSSIAVDMVTKATPDGYTILIASPSGISVNPAINPKLRYKASDLTPVTKITSSPLIIAVNPKLGAKTVAELITLAKASPGVLNFASSGNGSAPHLGAALFSQVAGVQMQHIPFKGGAPAIQSVVAGDTQVTFGTPPSVLPQVAGGNLVALGISAPESSPLFKGIPGMNEAGLPAFEIDFWYGIFVPGGTPDAIVKVIYDATHKAMAEPKVALALERQGTEVSVSKSQAEFVKFIAQNEKFWLDLVKSAGVKVD
jgi:tripartite-type tricarboxylate transporter receptor subunit TctC